MIRKSGITALLIIVGSFLYAQVVVINGEQTNRQLTWNDFRGAPDPASSHFAYTYWNIFYKYDAFDFKGDTAKWKVIISVELGSNSWKRKDKVTDTLLRHEQGHFNIGILCAMEIQEKADKTVFFRHDYQLRLVALIKEVIEKYRNVELQYDKETEHFFNRKQQWKWDNFFSAKLKGK
ncbi:MAG: DUF922 domain-containing protein [Bacteroidota bacterium]